MFCLRSWLPLLFIPTNASPAFILIFFVCTYFLNRPCVYCSLLLLILFCTSCNWSDQCFFDFSASDWFAPRPLSSAGSAGSNPVGSSAVSANMTGDAAEWTGLGIHWVRGLLGRKEWIISSLDVKLQL